MFWRIGKITLKISLVAITFFSVLSIFDDSAYAVCDNGACTETVNNGGQDGCVAGWNTCVGAAWLFFEVDDGPNVAQDPDNVVSDAKTDCAKQGTVGYYISVYLRTEDGSTFSTPNSFYTEPVKPRFIHENGGTYSHSVAVGGEDEETVKERHAEAKERSDKLDDYEDSAAFCSNGDVETEEMMVRDQFKGKVVASANNGSKTVSVDSGWSSNNSGEIVTREEKTTVNFKEYRMCAAKSQRAWLRADPDTGDLEEGDPEDWAAEYGDYTGANKLHFEDTDDRPHSDWKTKDNSGSKISDGTFYYSGTSCGGGGDEVGDDYSQEVTLAPGGQATVCSSISYDSEVETYFTRAYAKKIVDSFDDREATSKGSAKSCITVKRPYNYDTTATASINSGDIIAPGSSVKAQYSIEITGRKNPAEGGATAYQLDLGTDGYIKKVAVFTIDSGVETPNNDLLKGSVNKKNEAGDLCARLRELGAKNCNEENFNASKNITIPDLALGTKVCTVSAINHADSHGYPNDPLSAVVTDANYGANATSMSATTSNKWRISPMACKTVGMRPSFAIMNSGFLTEGTVKASVTATDPGLTKTSPYFGGVTAATTLYGSWVEYPLIVGGDSFGIASAAGLGLPNGRAGTTTTFYSDYSKMSIDNTSAYATDGKLSNAAVNGTNFAQKVKDRFGGMTDGMPGEQVVIGEESDSDKFVVENRSSNLTLGETHWTSGSKVIIVNGTLTITGNICYDSSCGGDLSFLNRNKASYSELAEIPQLILVADEIRIGEGVDQIDAWLISTGRIDTCDGYDSSNLSSAVCNKTLFVNGPVVANDITLDRTNVKYGVGSFSGNGVADSKLDDYGSATAAEVLNFNPSTWIWAMYQAQREEYATVTYMKELAPRL